MWPMLIGVIVDILIGLFLPLLRKWLDRLLNAVRVSDRAASLLAAAQPRTVEEFALVWPLMLDAGIDEAATSPAARHQLRRAKARLLRPRVVACAWNQVVATGKIAGAVPAPDSSHRDIVAEANAAK